MGGWQRIDEPENGALIGLRWLLDLLEAFEEPHCFRRGLFLAGLEFEQLVGGDLQRLCPID